jgi:hypothetical protein
MSKVTTTFEAVDSGMVATIQKIERETKSMKETTQKTEKQVDLSFAAMAKAGAGLAVGIGIVKGAFAAITGTLDKFGEALDMGGRLSDLSARTGETAGNLLLLERAFQNTGISSDKVGTSINKLQKFMSDAQSGTDKNIKVINQLGLSYDQLAQLSPTEQLGMIAEKINNISSPTERAATAMTIFGKSGGALLPFLQNFAGEMANAQTELGSLTRIMDAKNAVFDTVSDKIEIIKGKFTEFAAGVLSQVIPALELFTTVIANFDAAGFGEKLAGAFIGGQNAMDGFSSALRALKMGEISLSFQITFKALELQIKQSLNQIYLYVVSTFDGIVAFIKSMFGTGSALVSIFNATFSLIASSFEQKITMAALGIAESMSAILPGVASGLSDSIKRIDHDISSAQNRIGNGFEDIIPQALQAGEAFSEGFDKSFKTTKPLLDTLETSTELLALKGKEAELTAKAASAALGDSLDLVKQIGKTPLNPLKPMEESGKLISMKMQKTGDDLKGIKQTVKEISMIQKLMNELTQAITKKEAGIDPLKGELKNQIEQGKFKQAENTIKKIAIKEQEASIRIDEAGKKDRRSLQDIARDEGINTIGKSKEELRKEILEKRKVKKEVDEVKKEKEKKGTDKEPEKKADALIDVVKLIRDIVAKIEPKLPTHALAL